MDDYNGALVNGATGCLLNQNVMLHTIKRDTLEKDNCNGALVNDASPCYLNQNVMLPTVNRDTLETFLSVLDRFTIDDYRSSLFLLLDYSTPEDFLSLTKSDKSVLKDKIHGLFVRGLREEIILDMLGTMKMYKELKSFNTCCHIFKEGKYFNEIREIRKVLYSLCEEVTDEDLDLLKQHLPCDIRDEVVCAEHWFAYALKYKIIADTDLTRLKEIFKDYPDCLEIINQYKGEPKLKDYFIRTTTRVSHCGIAVIFNFVTFEGSDLRPRYGSDADVESLENLWNAFGFQTFVHENLTLHQLEEKLQMYAQMNHSNYDIFVACFLSHGNSGVIYTHDSYPKLILPMISIITEKCVTLEGKPKLFFVQACQGQNCIPCPTYQGIQTNYGNPTYTDEDSSPEISDNNSDFPILKDVFLVKSTIDGYASYRSPVTGGIFVQTLCKVMMECDKEDSIDDIMTIVTHRLASQGRNVIQIVPIYKTLSKRLMLKRRVVQ